MKLRCTLDYKLCSCCNLVDLCDKIEGICSSDLVQSKDSRTHDRRKGRKNGSGVIAWLEEHDDDTFARSDLAPSLNLICQLCPIWRSVSIFFCRSRNHDALDMFDLRNDINRARMSARKVVFSVKGRVPLVSATVDTTILYTINPLLNSPSLYLTSFN